VNLDYLPQLQDQLLAGLFQTRELLDEPRLAPLMVHELLYAD
jgi:hypothetical protein